MQDIISEIIFLFQRFNWLTVVDLLIVSVIFYTILMLLRNTRARTLLRGIIFVVVGILLLTTLVDLPAFSYLVQSAFPALLFSIPVIFSSEIRRVLERVGRAGQSSIFFRRPPLPEEQYQITIDAISTAALRLSQLKQGALIILQLRDDLSEYIETGILMNAKVTPELLLQIFFPNTPLHDGASVIVKDKLIAASCVLPLSSKDVLNQSLDHQMGLRHRAALGLSENSDALAIVVSEETGDISIAHMGEILDEIKPERLSNTLKPFINYEERFNHQVDILQEIKRIIGIKSKKEEEK